MKTNENLIQFIIKNKYFVYEQNIRLRTAIWRPCSMIILRINNTRKYAISTILNICKHLINTVTVDKIKLFKKVRKDYAFVLLLYKNLNHVATISPFFSYVFIFMSLYLRVNPFCLYVFSLPRCSFNYLSKSERSLFSFLQHRRILSYRRIIII